ncbi:hypothetical protein LAZ40_10905 [Cereibacter sphaeroides]|uniref:hypothetical protein n=1 Tax=Cereibacter sphaeroides TaxID=1063 RepID=UPI001F30D0F7|nr:hypothetical protein [Cereibacter sphaeroides]MCE6959564.1 hypothetical protein [Cereibacter sphaeroides]MCE6974576.1 hypothetical protein [Cereibacter sphaeroides]
MLVKARTLLATLVLAVLPMTAPASTGRDINAAQIPINDRPMLILLGRVEGPDGYNTISYSSDMSLTKPLTQMTLQEVLDFQDRMVRNGAASSAIGKYQFIRDTLAELIEIHDLDPTIHFDRRMQDYLARIKMQDCGFYDPKLSDIEVGNCLARTWAALPVLTGSKRGRSYYHGTAGNKSRVSLDTMLAVLENRF